MSVSWDDPKIAAELTNDLISKLNIQLRDEAITDSKKRISYLEEELSRTTLQDMRSVLYSLMESEKESHACKC